jgi:signal transduction histidine kinase
MTLRRRLLTRFGLAITLGLGAAAVINALVLARQVRTDAEAGLKNVTEAVHQTALTSYRIYQDTVNQNLKVADHFVRGQCRLDAGRPVEMRIQNQITGESRLAILPALVLAGEPERIVNDNPDVADEITDLVGGTVTVFQLIDEGLLRVSTSVTRRSGERVTGTYIPTESDVYRDIVEGKTYRGRAYVVDDWYIAAYKPLIDPGGTIIGAIYVGVNQQELAALRRAMNEFSLGESSYSFIIDDDGNFLIHPEWGGKNVHELENTSPRASFEKMKAEAAREADGAGFVRYKLTDSSGHSRYRRNYFRYIPDMEWYVVTGVDESELMKPVFALLRMNALGGVLTFLVLGLVIYLTSRAVAKPIGELARSVSRFSTKDFEVELPANADEEVAQLGASFKRIAAELKLSYEELESKVDERTRELQESNLELTEATRAADRAAKAKGAFLASMSHEIRTPMNAVIGMTTLLRATELDREQRACVETIRTSGDALLHIINDILDFTKIESGKLQLEQAPFEIAVCVEEAIDLVSQRAAEKHLELAYRIDSRVPSCLVGDISRLRQVLLNLLSNAVKFTAEGEVVLEVHAREGAASDAVGLEFVVRDTGIGIDEEGKARLFKSFSQADTSTTRRFGGTGLGLAISKRLIEAMGGEIRVESEPGEGSTFYFTLPL